MRDWTKNQITAVWIRHGATEANRERRYLGKTDEPLSQTGRAALLEKKKKGCYPDVRYLFSSPMKRCLQTAELLYSDVVPVVIPEWEEMDFGRFELKNYRELKEDAYYRAWINSGGTLPFPEGESREAFVRRCEAGFQRMCGILERLLRKEGTHDVTVGMTVHGGTIMALFDRYCGGGYFDYQTENGNGYRCRIADREGRAVLTDPRPLVTELLSEEGNAK